MDAPAFTLASLTLLATPGPTNALLATSGATSGLRASLPLLIAELSGYLLAILGLKIALGPMITAAPAFGTGLRVVLIVYLVYLAVVIWRYDGTRSDDPGPITLQRIFITTVLNPKAMVFAFVLLPSAETLTSVDLVPRLLALAVLIPAMGTVWIAAGASLHREGIGTRLAHRASAAALALIAVAIGIQAIGTAS